MAAVNVIKSSGEKQLFDPQKVRRAVLRSKVSINTADKITKEVENRIYEGIPT